MEMKDKLHTSGSYIKPYIWDDEEIASNLNESIRFELEKLTVNGRITTSGEVTAVLKATLDRELAI